MVAAKRPDHEPNALKARKSEIVDIFLAGGRPWGPGAAAAGQTAAFPLNGGWFAGLCRGFGGVRSILPARRDDLDPKI